MLRFAETLDLTAWEKPMAPLPASIEQAMARGVQAGDYPLSRLTSLECDGDGMHAGVVRNADGTMLVACHIDMPGVEPVMWDWWFGWMGGSSARYRLWHPLAHVSSALEHDRRDAPTLRGQYVGNAHLVEEYIGKDLQKLRIAFVEPATFGFDPASLDAQGTAICARTGLLGKPVRVGHLVHFIRKNQGGCEMLSRFVLGHVEIDGLFGPIASWLANRKAARTRAIPDQFGLDLLRHCAEEMNHLAALLPSLYAQFGPEGSAE